MSSKLINCPDCSKEVSKSAKKCPHCGKKLKMGFFPKLIIGFIGFVFLLSVWSGFSSVVTESSSEYSSSERAAQQTTASQEVSKHSAKPTLNDVVRVGHMEWVITNVKVGKRFSSDFADVKVGSDETILVWVFGKVTNRSSEEDATFSGDLYLVDDAGYQYGESDEGTFVADPLALDSFNPNVPKKFSTIFEVPNSAKGLCLRVTDFAVWSEETKLIDLGIE